MNKISLNKLENGNKIIVELNNGDKFIEGIFLNFGSINGIEVIRLRTKSFINHLRQTTVIQTKVITNIFKTTDSSVL